MDLSKEDFERLQTSLLELKTEKYALQEQCRKQKSALGDATARVSVLEQSLSQAQKTLQQSKKAAELQQLKQEKVGLQRQLASQEDEFRQQHQALLDELTKLVTSNERMEEQIQTMQSGGGGGQTADVDRSAALQEEVNHLKESLSHAQDQVAFWRQSVASADSWSVDEEATAPQRVSPETVQVGSDGGGKVSFRKSSLRRSSVEEENQAAIAELKADRDSLSAELDETRRELRSTKQRCQENEARQEEVRKENEQLRSDLETARQQQRAKSLALESDKTRLQGQLQNGYTSFNDYKKKKAEEIQELMDKIGQLESKLSCCSPELVDDLECKLKAREEELSESRSDRTSILEEKSAVEKRAEHLEARIQSLQEEQKKLLQLSEQFEEVTKTSEKRKSLLDEMAISMQVKSSEHNEVVAELEKSLEEAKQEIESNQTALSSAETRLSDLSSSLDHLRQQHDLLSADKARLESELSEQSAAHEEAQRDLNAAHRDALDAARLEQRASLSSLRVQLDISDAQRVEFEEKCAALRQEMLDVHEERKIGEKKGGALLKDLKRQLMAEKTRNERLQEKMRECSFNAESSPVRDLYDPDRSSISSWSLMSGQNEHQPHRPSVVGVGVGSQHASTPSSSPFNESLPADDDLESVENEMGNGNESDEQRHSGPDDQERAASMPPPPPVDVVPGGGGGPKAPPSSTRTERDMLLAKIALMQEERLVLEEKNHMLEHSAAAMADDLVKKAEIIQHYCMEGRGRRGSASHGAASAASAMSSSAATGSPGPSASSSSLSLSLPGEPKLSVKRMVTDLLSHHPDAAENKREMQRMHNMLEETLTKNMHLQRDLELMSKEVARLAGQAPTK